MYLLKGDLQIIRRAGKKLLGQDKMNTFGFFSRLDVEKNICFSDFSFSPFNSRFPTIYQPWCPLWLLTEVESVFRLFFSEQGIFPLPLACSSPAPHSRGSVRPAATCRDHAFVFRGNASQFGICHLYLCKSLNGHSFLNCLKLKILCVDFMPHCGLEWGSGNHRREHLL